MTLEELRACHSWFWLYCGNPACQRAVPVAIVPYIIRWGPGAPAERLGASAICRRCGHKGGSLRHVSWLNSIVGWQSWPAG